MAVCGWSSGLGAAEVVTHPYPGITHIRRTDAMTGPTRQVRMNIVLVDLTAPEVRFKMTPEGQNLPLPLFGSPGWPLPYPPFETVRQTTLGFLESSHAQLAIDTHFFAPFPVPAGSNQGAYAYLIGLAASRGNVYSAFEAPFQNYALVRDSPGINIDRENRASVVHRDPDFADGKHVLEDVTLWNAFAGSAQIVTNGVKSLPFYVDADHPDGQLIPPGPANYSNSNSWYNLVNARTSIGLTRDNQTLVLFTVDVRPTTGPDRSNGMRVGEVADVLINDYGVHNALNMDGGGSTTMAMQDPVDHVRRVINTPSDAAPGRAEGANFAVYSDGVMPATTAVVSPEPNANGWNNTNVNVSLDATDLRSGISDNPVGWVDQLQYSLAGAQTSDPQVVAGHTASIEVTTQGITTLTYFATDAAGNDELARALAVRLDGSEPDVDGLPAAGCTLWPPNHKMRRVAVVSAADALSGVAPGSLQVTATSSEPSDPSDPDVLVTPDGSGGFVIELRAERLGSGPGRLYTMTATAKDLAGNVRTVTATCTVPHDQGKR
jgi:hypothetical protein